MHASETPESQEAKINNTKLEKNKLEITKSENRSANVRMSVSEQKKRHSAEKASNYYVNEQTNEHELRNKNEVMSA